MSTYHKLLALPPELICNRFGKPTHRHDLLSIEIIVLWLSSFEFPFPFPFQFYSQLHFHGHLFFVCIQSCSWFCLCVYVKTVNLLVILDTNNSHGSFEYTLTHLEWNLWNIIATSVMHIQNIYTFLAIF